MTVSLKTLLDAVSTQPWQDLETMFLDIATAHDIDNIEGDQLERMCNALGTPYIPSDLDLTRALWYGYVAAYSSDGTAKDIANAWKKITNDQTAYITAYYPTTLELHTSVDIPTATADQMLAIMRQAKTAGVEITCIIYDGEPVLYDTVVSTVGTLYDTVSSTNSKYCKILAQ